MHVKNVEAVSAISSPHGETVREVIGRAAGGASDYSLAHITLPPGAASLKHYHPVVEESYFILKGQGRMVVDDETQHLNAGDAVAITPDAVHQIFNDSDEDLSFLAVCVPPWTPDCSVFVE